MLLLKLPILNRYKVEYTSELLLLLKWAVWRAMSLLPRFDSGHCYCYWLPIVTARRVKECESDSESIHNFYFHFSAFLCFLSSFSLPLAFMYRVIIQKYWINRLNEGWNLFCTQNIRAMHVMCAARATIVLRLVFSIAYDF